MLKNVFLMLFFQKKAFSTSFWVIDRENTPNQFIIINLDESYSSNP